MKTVDVTLVDEYNYEYTYKLDNPRDNVTRTEIIAAFSNVLNSDFIVSKSGSKFSSIGKTIITEITKTNLT